MVKGGRVHEDQVDGGKFSSEENDMITQMG